jgi:hypothetical protein
MNEDAFNASIRKFLKTLSVTAQREIERRSPALADGRIKGHRSCPRRPTVTIASVGRRGRSRTRSGQ